jgi:methionyl-tRNA synthetase
MEKNWLIFVIIAALWTIPWKGAALWKSAKNGHKIWFIVLFLINTLALLEIIYIFFFSEKKPVLSAEKDSLNSVILEKQIIYPKKFV